MDIDQSLKAIIVEKCGKEGGEEGMDIKEILEGRLGDSVG